MIEVVLNDRMGHRIRVKCEYVLFVLGGCFVAQSLYVCAVVVDILESHGQSRVYWSLSCANE